MTAATVEPLGDQALLLRWDAADERAANRRVHACARRLHAAAPAWLVDAVPAYASLAVFFDALRIDGDDPQRTLAPWLAALAAAGDDDGAGDGRRVEIPVCYGGEHGPDLAAVAAASGLSAADVIARHAGGDYVVAMLGFAPGFPYLLGLDPALAVPRLATPRLRVPAGSVGIGGAQTGVYPQAGPGGWQLIGRTPQRLFAPARTPPTALLPGDRLRFVAIDAARFAALAAEAR